MDRTKEQGMTGFRDRFSVGLPRTAVIIHALCRVWFAWTGLHQLRYAIEVLPPVLPLWSMTTAIVLVAQGLVLWQVGLYRGIWRFASVPDLLNILKASVFGLVAILLSLFLYNRANLVPRTVLVLYPIVLTALLGMPRLLYRSWKDHGLARTDKAALRVLIL